MIPSTLESVLLGALVIVLLLWWAPGLRAAIAYSRRAESDWSAVLWPLAMVVLFVIGLVILT